MDFEKSRLEKMSKSEIVQYMKNRSRSKPIDQSISQEKRTRKRLVIPECVLPDFELPAFPKTDSKNVYSSLESKMKRLRNR